MSYNVALIGNPNSGKTSLFNYLTGMKQKVGNRIGVTVEEKEGYYLKDKSVKIIDLPGTYSLTAISEDEKVVNNYVKSKKIDAIINVIDGTNIERSLYLTTELLSLNVPILVAVNMFDVMQKRGLEFNFSALENLFNVKVIKISVKKRINLKELVEHAVNNKKIPKPISFLGEKDYYVERAEKISSFVKQNLSEKIKKPYLDNKIDKILLHSFWGYVIFAITIFAVFYLSSKIGGVFSETINSTFSTISERIKNYMLLSNQTSWFTDLVSVAIIKGIGSVLAFLPQVLVLFLCLTIIEESGYSTRIAFLTDKIFYGVGLSGKSLISLTLSLGCNVNGVISTRTIDGESERRLAIILCPFMPCSAKTAVFSWMSYSFFNSNPLVSASLYFLGLFTCAISGAILKNFKAFGQNQDVFLLEIPELRLPSIKNVLIELYEKIKDFLLKAGSIIFAVSVLIWFLQNFGVKGYVGGNEKQSFLYSVGNAIKNIFVPLGFGSPEASVSVLTGFLAKEAVIETLEILNAEKTTLFSNAFSAYSFMAFVLLSPPCISALSTAKRELKSKKWFAFMIIFEILIAYIISFIINLIGIIISTKNRLPFLVLFVIIIAIGTISFVRLLKGKRCKNCSFCKKDKKLCLKK